MQFFNKHVVPYARWYVLDKKMQNDRADSRSIKKYIETRYSVKLSDEQKLILKNYTRDLTEVLNPWVPVLREIHSNLEKVQLSSEPRE